MNKRQRKILGVYVENEKNVLLELQEIYRESIKCVGDIIKELQEKEQTQSVIYQVKYQKQLQSQLEKIYDDMIDNNYESIRKYIHRCYEDGFLGAMYDIHGQGVPLIFPIDQEQVTRVIINDTKLSKDLYESLGYDMKPLKNNIKHEISRGIASALDYSDIARNIDNVTKINFNRAYRIARTEGHRVQQQATFDAQKKSSRMGANIVKQWDSTLDSRTRESHRKLDGQIKELEEPFVSNGHKAMHPSDFGRPEEDINCRCVILQRAKWGLTEDELETLKKRAEYFGLDKTKDFEEFREKYINASKNEKLIIDELQLEEKEEPKTFEDKIKVIQKRVKDNGVFFEKDLLDAGEIYQEEYKNVLIPKIEKSKKLYEEYNSMSETITKKYSEIEEKYDSELEKLHKKFADNNHELFKKVDELDKKKLKWEKEVDKLIKIEQEKWEEFTKNNITTKDKIELMKETLSRVRKIGYDKNEINIHLNKSKSPVKESIIWGYSCYPTEWVKKSIDYGNLTVKKVNRGYYSDYNKEIAISGNELNKQIGTAIHELGHRFESVISGIILAEKEFYKRRTEGEELKWLGPPYPKTEKTRKDEFLNPYMGKDYGGRVFELVSMGFQYAFTEPEKLLKDEDMAKWIFGILTLL